MPEIKSRLTQVRSATAGDTSKEATPGFVRRRKTVLQANKRIERSIRAF